jgi:hypothetical protein
MTRTLHMYKLPEVSYGEHSTRNKVSHERASQNVHLDISNKKRTIDLPDTRNVAVAMFFFVLDQLFESLLPWNRRFLNRPLKPHCFQRVNLFLRQFLLFVHSAHVAYPTTQPRMIGWHSTVTVALSIVIQFLKALLERRCGRLWYFWFRWCRQWLGRFGCIRICWVYRHKSKLLFALQRLLPEQC